MKMQKKVPLRTCVISREKCPKQALIRVVRTPDGEVTIDLTGKQNGRGAYIKKEITVVQKARKTKQLERHLSIAIPDSIYDELERLVSDGTTGT